MAPLKLISASDESNVICVYDKDGKPTKTKKGVRTYAKFLLDVFLPAGYPHTVTEDYTKYQIYDSLQAFSSTIASLLSSRAVLQGLGLGESSSAATAAVLFTVAQDSAGRIATIMFAHVCGRAIEPECKFFRYFADIVNDAALVLDLISPALPFQPKIFTICLAGILRALCGISGGAAKASLSAHFAKTGNLAELNAKDGSQETVISLMGMLVGSMLVHYVHSKTAVWAWMIVLIGTHLWTNYQAVRAVQLRTLNEQRLYIVMKELLSKDIILRPDQVAARERILDWWSMPIHFATEPPALGEITPAELEKSRLLWYVIAGRGTRKTKIFLKQGANERDALLAWIDAFTDPPRVEEIQLLWPTLAAAGWDLQTNALEKGRAIRIKVDDVESQHRD
ncbi:DUF647-domain-containing protein [Durotheca rogersii]|uniref:DUF647-domain-containing protein n=1 Tax=Durotheca rogersii TaxID=419775 RepID=UPI002220CE21|nr:DUF647-domain-containing protein [Durotheca rogersii]KAI5863563.1 DUF647-domain-containing protein [Durotheca rogersii]